MDRASTYYYREIENVEFKEDNISWVNNFVTSRSSLGREHDRLVIFYKEEGKAESFKIEAPRKDIRTAVSFINDQINKQ